MYYIRLASDIYSTKRKLKFVCLDGCNRSSPTSVRVVYQMVALLWSDAKLINGRLRVKDDVPGHQIVLSSLSAA